MSELSELGAGTLQRSRSLSTVAEHVIFGTKAEFGCVKSELWQSETSNEANYAQTPPKHVDTSPDALSRSKA